MPQQSRPVAVGAPQAIDCLVALQEGQGIDGDLHRLLDPARLQGAGPQHQDRRTGLSPACPTGWRSARRTPTSCASSTGFSPSSSATVPWQQLQAKWLGHPASSVRSRPLHGPSTTADHEALGPRPDARTPAAGERARRRKSRRARDRLEPPPARDHRPDRRIGRTLDGRERRADRSVAVARSTQGADRARREADQLAARG